MNRLLSMLLAVVGISHACACLFVPNIEQYGYVKCQADRDCEPGRSCDDNVCAPPAWHDERFDDRRVLIVRNNAAEPMPAGTAVPVVVGGEGAALTLDDVKPDARFADFDTATKTWKIVPVFRDLERERFTVWIPTQREVAQGKSDVLAWLEADTEEGQATVSENAEGTFTAFDTFDDASAQGALDPAVWNVLATGGTPLVEGGQVNVADNQAIVLSQRLVPPVTATLVARVNGTTCDDVYLGFVGDDDARVTAPPAAGFFMDTNLAGNVLVAPTADSQPRPEAPFTGDTTQHRFTMSVDGAAVRLLVDGQVAHEDADLRPPFGDDALYLAVQVGGACSVTVDAAWATPLPLPAPSLTVGPLVERGLFD